MAGTSKIDLRPDEELAKCLAAGNMSLAVSLLENRLKVNPQDPASLYFLALLEQQSGKLHEALGHMLAASRLSENSPEILQALAQLAITSSDFHIARDAASKLVRLAPSALAFFFLGVSQMRLGNIPDARVAFEKALGLDASLHPAWHELGQLLHGLAEYEKAVACYDKAATGQQANPWFHYNYALTLEQLSSWNKAQAHWQKATELKSDQLEFHLRQAYLLARRCRYEALAQTRKVIGNMLDRLEDTEDCLVSPYVGYVLGLSLEHQQILARAYSRQFKMATREQPASQGNKIRLVYLGADFENTAVAPILQMLLKHHDRDRFSIFALINQPGPDVRADYLKGVDVHCVHQLTDKELADLLESIKPDLLVDVTAYTRHGRPSVFSLYRPARTMSLWGYLGSSQSGLYDYLLADAVCVTRAEERQFSETVIRHPSGLFPLLPCINKDKTLTRDQFGLPEDAFVFASFNSAYKLSPEVLHAWARILSACDSAVLWLGGLDEEQYKVIVRLLQEKGVEKTRIIRADTLPYYRHVQRLDMADLHLDSFPYSGGATTLACLQAALPVLAMEGRNILGRMSVSINRHAGFGELCSADTDDYVSQAEELVANPARYKKIREKLQLVCENIHNHKWYTEYEAQLSDICSK